MIPGRMGKYVFLFVLVIQIKGYLYGQSFSVLISSDDDTEICQGDSVAVTLTFSGGSSPYTVVINDKDGEYIELSRIRSPYTFYVYPESDNSYYIASAYDRRGRTGVGIGTVTVTVYPFTPVSILLERTAYLASEPGVPLLSDPPGGTFSGSGVIGNIFYPGLVPADGSPHQIFCSQVNTYGCESEDMVEVWVLLGNPSVHLVSGTDTVSSFCGNLTSCLIRGSNEDNLPGHFLLFKAGTTDPIPGHINDQDLNDNEAQLLLDGLSGGYEIVYSYGMQLLEISASREFSAHDIGLLGILDLPETVCKNDAPYPLLPDASVEDPAPVYIFSGPGVMGNQAEGFYFDPSHQEVPPGPVQITLEYTSSFGCESELSITVYVGRVPDLGFTTDGICLEPVGSQVLFINQSNPKEIVTSWNWDFGDPSSGNANKSSQENPEHFYADPGPRTIVLEALTGEGCLAQQELEILFVDRPVVDYSWLMDCYVGEGAIPFEASPTSIYSPLDTMIWTIRTPEGGLVSVAGKGPEETVVDLQFPAPGTYHITLFSNNVAGCQGEVTRQMELIPVQVVSADGYLESFNAIPPRWKAASEDSLQSWVHGEPDFSGFEPVEDDLSWYTKLPAHREGYLERSWVRSPCFDLSGMNNPVIQMDLMKSFRPGLDGAVLQYQGALGNGWHTLGVEGEGQNWYNDTAILHMPGGSTTGWGLVNEDPDEQWITAHHAMPAEDWNTPVKFRLIIASGGTQEYAPGRLNQGFAFDNFLIRDALFRRSVLEYFTNTAGDLTYAADSAVKSFAMAHSGMLYDLHYHMDYPEEDPMNAHNPSPPSTRSFNYGVPGIPYAVLNGGVTPEYRFDLSPPTGHLDDEILKTAASETPLFDLTLLVDYQEDRLEGFVKVTCRTDLFESNLQLYIVVLEKEVTSYPYLSRDSTFRNVVLDMLPNATGKLLGSNWYTGSFATWDFTWDYADYLEDREDLSVVAFVQDRDKGWILQAGEVSFSTAVGSGDMLKADHQPMTIYPNPVRDDLMVSFNDRTGPGDQLVLVDLSGREVMLSRLPQGVLLQHIDVSHLEAGMYTLLWKEGRIIRGYAKVIRQQ